VDEPPAAALSRLEAEGFLRGSLTSYATAGADGAIVLARKTAEVDALVAAVERW